MEEKAAELAAIAQADEMSVSEAARIAIDRHIEERRQDKEFRSRVRRLMAENNDVLARLAG